MVLNHTFIRNYTAERVPDSQRAETFPRVILAERELVSWADEQRVKQEKEREFKARAKKNAENAKRPR